MVSYSKCIDHKGSSYRLQGCELSEKNALCMFYLAPTRGILSGGQAGEPGRLSHTTTFREGALARNVASCLGDRQESLGGSHTSTPGGQGSPGDSHPGRTCTRRFSPRIHRPCLTTAQRVDPVVGSDACRTRLFKVVMVARRTSHTPNRSALLFAPTP